MPRPPSANYRFGALYSLTTAFLLSIQEPLCFPAAHRFSLMQFVCLNQIALLASVPLLILKGDSRRDFAALLRDPSQYGKFAALFAIGIIGLLLYNFGLSNSHPVTVAAILNLSPFWAALVAKVISRVPIPISPFIFFGCLAAAFMGAMMVAWSQIAPDDAPTISGVVKDLLGGSWVYAVPVPICSALSGTLVGKWFGKHDKSGTIAVNFLLSGLVVVPPTLFIVGWRADPPFDQFSAVTLMFIGTIAAASVGRVLYQIALTVTGEDNGFVTMFFLLAPALAGLVSLALSGWVPDLHFAAGFNFFFGLALIAASLLMFSLKAWR